MGIASAKTSKLLTNYQAVLKVEDSGSCKGPTLRYNTDQTHAHAQENRRDSSFPLNLFIRSFTGRV